MTKLFLLLILIFNFCFATNENPLYIPSKSRIGTFLNSPFEKKPINQKASKGILLVHGLGDSPGYFQDLAQELVSQGFLVRTVLLAGHASKPADLINVEFEQWENLVNHLLLHMDIDEIRNFFIPKQSFLFYIKKGILTNTLNKRSLLFNSPKSLLSILSILSPLTK